MNPAVTTHHNRTKFKTKSTLSAVYILLVLLTSSCSDEYKADENKDDMFLRLYGNSYIDEGHKVIQTTDDGYLIAGTIEDDNELSDMVLIKTNKMGFVDWQITRGDSLSDFAHDMVLTNSGNMVVAGYKRSTTTELNNIFVFSADMEGNLLWEREYKMANHQKGYGIVQKPDGGFVIVGSTYAQGVENESDLLIFIISNQGDSLLSKTYGYPGMDVGFAICPRHNGGYVITGSSIGVQQNNQDESNLLALEINDNGVAISSQYYGGSNADIGHDIIQTTDGYLIVGTTSSSGFGRQDIYAVKTGIAIQELIWEKTFGGAGNDVGKSIIQNSNGSITIAGSTESFGNGGTDTYIVNISQEGNMIVAKTYGSSASEWANCLIETNDNGFAVTGATEYGENRMITLMKINPDYLLQ